MPCDYSKYPPIWKTEIRPRILKRAGQIIEDGKITKQACCEFCGVENKSVVFRNEDGSFEYAQDYLDVKQKGYGFYASKSIYDDRIRIVLTIAHLDHDEENWNMQDDRLAALCQQCHLRYDAPEKAKRRRKKKYKNSLFPIK